MPDYFNDSPIQSEADDEYGVTPFAKAIAKSILNISAPVGTTIALNGPWGTGKSSVVNLIRSELTCKENTHVTVIDFKCWWFRGEEALTLAFFQELNSALQVTLGDKAKNLIPKLGKQLLQAGPILGAAASLFPGGGLLSPLVSGGVDFAKRYFPEGDSLEDTFQKLSKLLKEQGRRFVIIIDDIDRLSPEEALAIFRLVKSVGRLPNVMYLLVFDRILADAAVQEKYPSEGPHFLEKIIQASFEIPKPPQTDLNNAFLTSAQKICGEVSEDDAVRFMNVFYDAIAPYLQTPRHVARLTNAISVTWPAIANEVNTVDFIALETMRLYEPNLFTNVRKHREMVTGAAELEGGGKRDVARFSPFMVGIPAERQPDAQLVLQRLFPALEEIHYYDGANREWDFERRVCFPKHFDTYFRLSLSEDALSSAALTDIFERADDHDFIREAFLNASRRFRKNGKSLVPVVLDELTSHAKRVPKEKVLPLLTTLFQVADEINFEKDSEGGFAIGSTDLRIHWLIRRLTQDRFTLGERTDLYLAAIERASFNWRVDFVSSAVRQHERDDGKAKPEDECLVSKAALPKLKDGAIAALRGAAIDGTLLASPHLMGNLYAWLRLSNDDGAEMKNWLAGVMRQDSTLIILAKALTSESWSSGMGGFGTLGDRVAKRHTRASISDDFDLFDPVPFRTALERIVREATADGQDIEAVKVFLRAWSKRANGEDD